MLSITGLTPCSRLVSSSIASSSVPSDMEGGNGNGKGEGAPGSQSGDVDISYQYGLAVWPCVVGFCLTGVMFGCSFCTATSRPASGDAVNACSVLCLTKFFLSRVEYVALFGFVWFCIVFVDCAATAAPFGIPSSAGTRPAPGQCVRLPTADARRCSFKRRSRALFPRIGGLSRSVCCGSGSAWCAPRGVVHKKGPSTSTSCCA